MSEKVKLTDIEYNEVQQKRQKAIDIEKEENNKKIKELKERIRTEEDGKYAWQLNLELDEKETLIHNEPVFKCTYQNLKNFINYCPTYAGKFYFNDMREDMYTTVLEKDDASIGEVNPTEDMVVSMIRDDAYSLFGKMPTLTDTKTAIHNVCLEHRYNPVVEALRKLKWDHKKRLETFFIDTLEAEDTPCVKEMTKKFFYAACNRAHVAGCDWDNMIILHGDQSIGKSKIMKRFCKAIGVEKYFAPVSNVDSSKDSNQIVDASWIVVWEELARLMKQESGEVKSVISAGDGFYRNSYGKGARLHKRKNVYIGNTNEDIFLKDYTSDVERRYWIIHCLAKGKDRTGEFWTQFDKKFNDNYYKQVAAEAMYYYENEKDYKYQILSESSREELIKIQAQHKTISDNAFADILFEVLDNIPECKYTKQSDFMRDFKKTLDMVTGDESYIPLNPEFRIKKFRASFLKASLEKYFTEVGKGRNYIEALLKPKFNRVTGTGNNYFFVRKEE